MPELAQMNAFGITIAERYQHPIAEYDQILKGSAVMDLSGFEYLSISGSDRLSWCHRMISQSLTNRAVQDTVMAWILTPAGKIAFDLTILVRENDLLLQTASGKASLILNHLEKYILMDDVHLRVLEKQMTLLFPRRNQWMDDTAYPWLEGIFHTCKSGGKDLEWVFPEPNLDTVASMIQGLTWVGGTALNIARVEAFEAWMRFDTAEDWHPLCIGTAHRIDHDKGCYIGQETIAMTRDRGRPPKLLVQATGTQETLTIGQPLFYQGKMVGSVTSSIFSPQYECPMILALISPSVAKNQPILTDKQGEPWTIRQCAFSQTPS
jgi:folate-binding protein YgfZ